MSLDRFRGCIAQAAFNTPIAMHPAKAEILMNALGPRILGRETVQVNVDSGAALDVKVPEKHAGQLGRSHLHPADRLRDSNIRRTSNGVAVIPVEGTLIHKGGWVGTQSGETSYQGLGLQIEEAIADEDIKAAVFEFDSFGGSVAGCGDCASLLATLTSLKPTMAIINDYAYSAAYWLASQCGSISISEAGGAGSIGVIWMHTNIGAALEAAKIDITILTAGQNKADGNPFEALPDAVRDEVSAELEIVRQQFARAVGSGRGSTLDAKGALALEAKTFMGNAALKAGLVDVVARPSEAYSAFVSQF